VAISWGGKPPPPPRHERSASLTWILAGDRHCATNVEWDVVRERSVKRNLKTELEPKMRDVVVIYVDEGRSAHCDVTSSEESRVNLSNRSRPKLDLEIVLVRRHKTLLRALNLSKLVKRSWSVGIIIVDCVNVTRHAELSCRSSSSAASNCIVAILNTNLDPVNPELVIESREVSVIRQIVKPEN